MALILFLKLVLPQTFSKKLMQNLIDYSIQEYGTPAAVFLIINDNPQLFAGGVELELTGSIDSATGIATREEDDLKDKKVLKELNGKTIV